MNSVGRSRAFESEVVLLMGREDQRRGDRIGPGIIWNMKNAFLCPILCRFYPHIE